MNKLWVGVVVGIATTGLVYAATSTYGATNFHFGVPSTVSALFYFLDGGSNSSTTLGGPASIGYYTFNSTNGYTEWTQGCSDGGNFLGTSIQCQNGTNRPKIRVKNTGTVSFTTVEVKLNSALQTGILMCANSSMNGGSGSAVSYACNTANKDILNNTQWWKLGTSITAGSEMNLSFYANFSNVAGGSYLSRLDVNVTG